MHEANPIKSFVINTTMAKLAKTEPNRSQPNPCSGRSQFVAKELHNVFGMLRLLHVRVEESRAARPLAKANGVEKLGGLFDRAKSGGSIPRKV
jgi:hypothetical protein